MPEDNPDRMDEDSSGRKSLPPGRSPAQRERSASPRARGRNSRRDEPRRWMYNPLMECVAHRSTECRVCGEYSSHLNNAAMDDDQSYIDAVSKKNAYFVPMTVWQAEVKKSADAKDERDRYRDRAHRAEKELDELRIAVHDLEKQLEVAQGQSYASTAARVANRPLTYAAPRAPVEPLAGKPVMKPFILLNTVKEGKATPLPLASTTATVPTPSPDKGKGRGSSTVVNDPYAYALSYDDSEGDDFDADTSADDSRARDSLAFRQLTAVLSGTSLTMLNASGSAFVEGRVMDINPRNMAEFRLLRSALEQAHNEGNPNTNDLLQIIRRFVGACHKSTRKTDLQKSVISQWRVPDWAEAVRYDHTAQTVVSTGMTKMDRINQKLQLDLAKQLGLMVEGKPHPRLGNLSSPRHEDHPALWRLWSRTVATSKPKGLTPGPDGMAYERSVRGFRLLAPMLKDTGNAKSKDRDDARRARQQHGRIVLMMLVARSRHYDHILAREGIHVSDTPSWGSIEFSDNPSETECVQHLAMRGVTPDELADAHQYAFGWLQATQEHENDVQLRISINQLLNVPRADNTLWPDSMSYHYVSTYSRWMPTIPAAPPAPSQTSVGTPSLLPLTIGIVPSATMVTDNPSTLSDENVNMDVPTAPPVEHVEDDNMGDASSPSGPL